MSTLETPIKFPGGKRWLIPRLRELLRGHETKRLVDPFCGAASISFGLASGQTALLNDSLPPLVNFLQWLQQGRKIIHAELVNDRVVYGRNRDKLNALIRKNGKAARRDAAELFYYVAKNGFNGLCRYNKSGECNVPFGAYKNIEFKTDFKEYRPVMQHWTISCGDFSELAVKPNDKIVVDPPYDDGFVGYSPGGFGWKDQIRLIEWLADATGPIVACNKATPRILDLYRNHGFDIELLSAPRRISCDGDRKPAQEMLAWRNV